MDITKEEAEVITILRNLPPASRERVLRMLRDLVVEGDGVFSGNVSKKPI